MVRRKEKGFIPIPPNRATKWTCTIAGTDISNFILSGRFPHGLISEELICEIELENSGENFTNKFFARDEIVFKMDFSDGSTVQFKGEIEEIRKKIDGGLYKLGIKGAHFTAQLLDVMVTEEYTGASISDIRKDLVDKYLTGFTYTKIATNTTTIDTKFVNKPFLDCFLFLDIQGDEDTYVDFDKDFHTFKRESIKNLNIHFTDSDSIISLKGLGTDSAEVRNKITVYGEAGGLPVIATSEDNASQTTYRTKESVITDTDIDDEDKAIALGNAETSQLKNPTEQGNILSLYWTGISPGDMAYIISPIHKIHDLFRIVKFVYNVPNEDMEVFFNQERSIPKLFKDRIKKEQGQEAIVNPHKMTHSYNFTFDNENKIDSVSSSNIIVSESKLRKGSEETGIMVSNEKDTPISVNSVHVLATGEALDGATYWIQADAQADFQQVTLDTLGLVDNPGTELRLQIKITGTNTRIDAAALLYKA